MEKGLCLWKNTVMLLKNSWSSHHREEQAGGFLVELQCSVQIHTISAVALPIFEHKRNKYLFNLKNLFVCHQQYASLETCK